MVADADGIENNPRNFYRYNQQGYNIGGPVWLPKIGSKYLKERLFFFFSQEWQEQLVPQNARQSRVPTALEAAGDFSQTKADGNAAASAAAVVIRNPATGLPFADNKIPANLINPNGQKILNLFRKFENTPLGGAVNGFRLQPQLAVERQLPAQRNQHPGRLQSVGQHEDLRPLHARRGSTDHALRPGLDGRHQPDSVRQPDLQTGAGMERHAQRHIQRSRRR